MTVIMSENSGNAGKTHNPSRGVVPGYARPGRIFDTYVDAAPSPQTAIDAVPGWVSFLPPESGATSRGTVPLFHDGRIDWAIEQVGGVAGKRVLELGPLDGGHTTMLVRAGAEVEAVEANRMAFLRCLVTKEVLGLTSARFHLGNFVRFLEERDETYDLIVASGVLYHMRDPVRLLELLRLRARSVYLWTHSYDANAMTAGELSVFASKPVEREYMGRRINLWKRTYQAAPTTPTFCGGMEDEHYWMERDGIEWVIGAGRSGTRILHRNLVETASQISMMTFYDGKLNGESDS